MENVITDFLVVFISPLPPGSGALPRDRIIPGGEGGAASDGSRQPCLVALPALLAEPGACSERPSSDSPLRSARTS